MTNLERVGERVSGRMRGEKVRSKKREEEG